MKKIFRLIAAIAATTVAFSCMEEANPEAPETGSSNYDGATTVVEFTLDELETRTSWDGEDHTWSEGDIIKLIWMDAQGQVGEVPAEVVDNKVTAEVGIADTYYAVYPERTAYVLETPEGATEPQFSVTIPKYQDGSFAQANIMAAKTSASEKMLAFKNLTHIFKFDLSEGCEYNFFRFCTNSTRNQESRYAGTPSLITFGEDDVTVGGPISGTGNTSYACVQLGKDATGPFYLGIRAGAITDAGFGVLASKTGKEGDFTGGLLTTTAVTTTRSKITYLGTLDNYISDDWYITSTGAGSGKSWSDPAGIGLLIDLMKNRTSAGETYSGNGTTDVYRLIDARIHIAAGTYNIHDASGESYMNVAGLAFDAADRYESTKITIIGGYPAQPSDGATQDLTNADNATIFKANTTNNSRIFRFDDQPLGYLIFDGITFKGAGETAVFSAGAASYFNKATPGVVTYKNCDFIDFNNSNSGSHGNLLINSTSELTINFEGCKFTGNSSSSNGTIAVTAEHATVNMTNCEISNNTAASGGAIYVTKGVVNLDNCKFTGNGAGAIPATSAAAQSDVTVNRGGSLYISGGEVHINRCIFDGNYANLGADIAVVNDDTKVFINRSVFKNGTAYYYNSKTEWRGKSIESHDKATLCLNNCIFCNNTSKFIEMNTGLPCIKTNGDKTVVVNTSFYDGSMRFINQTDATASYTVNCIAKCDASKRGLTKWGTCKYNLSNSEVQTDDTDYGDGENLVMSWTDATNTLTWTLNESITIAKYATVTEISTDLSTNTNFAEFDTWLNTIEDNPYGIDFYGNTRNAEKMNPGAWDPGL